MWDTHHTRALGLSCDSEGTVWGGCDCQRAEGLLMSSQGASWSSSTALQCSLAKQKSGGLFLIHRQI